MKLYFGLLVLAEVLVAKVSAPPFPSDQFTDVMDPVAFAEREGYEEIPETRSNKRLAFQDESPLEMLDEAMDEEGKVRLKRIMT